MESEFFPAHLWVQLGVSALFVLLMVIIHGLGLLGIGKLLRLDEDTLRKHEMDTGAVLLIGTTGLLLFLLHFIEIVIFAIFFVWAEPSLETFDDAIYFSASAYATLGASQVVPDAWRLVGAFEAVIGFVLIGWSTAFVARMMNRLSA